MPFLCPGTSLSPGGGEALGTGVQQPGAGNIPLSSVFGEIQTIALNGHACGGQHTDWHLLCNTPRGRIEISLVFLSCTRHVSS